MPPSPQRLPITKHLPSQLSALSRSVSVSHHLTQLNTPHTWVFWTQATKGSSLLLSVELLNFADSTSPFPKRLLYQEALSDHHPTFMLPVLPAAAALPRRAPRFGPLLWFFSVSWFHSK